MDYEKEYKSLVAKVKKAYLFTQTDSTKSALEDILPELRESEDERMIKSMTRLVKAFYDCNFPTPEGFEREDMLAYLEKQKEQKPIPSNSVGLKEQKPILEVFGFKVGDAVRLKDGDGRKHIIKSFEEVEGLHGLNFYHVKFEDNSAIDFICPGEEYPNGYYTKMEKFEEEQKPAPFSCSHENGTEWSEKYIADIFEKVGLAKIVREQGNDELTNAVQSAMLELSKVGNAEWSEDTKTNLDRALQIVKAAKGTLCGYQSDDGIYECEQAIQTLEHILKNGIKQKPAECGDNDEIVSAILSALASGLDTDDILKARGFTYEDVEQFLCSIHSGVKCIEFSDEFSNQVSHLLASVLNGEHPYRKDFIEYAAQSLLGYAKAPISCGHENGFVSKTAERKNGLTDFENSISHLLADKCEIYYNENLGGCYDLKGLCNTILKLAYKELQLELKHDLFEAKQEGREEGYEAGVYDTEQKTKQAEWSEEDERKIVELKTFIAECNGFNKSNRQKAFEMIDSLRPSWKPSKEQMKAFEETLFSVAYTDNRFILSSLFEQLKKLM